MMEKLKFLMSWLWEFLKPFIRTILTEAGKAVVMSAKNAVAAAASMPAGTSNEKRRAAAFKMIEADLKKSGYTIGAQVSESMINTAIELAVQALKAK